MLMFTKLRQLLRFLPLLRKSEAENKKDLSGSCVQHCSSPIPGQQLVAPEYRHTRFEQSQLLPLAIHLNVSSEDCSTELIAALQSIPVNFDLYITTTDDSDVSFESALLTQCSHLLQVRQGPVNDNQIQQYSHHCYLIHPKHSAKANDKVVWNDLFTTFFANEDSVCHALELLEQQNVGLVYPDLHYSSINAALTAANWGKQKESATWIAQHLQNNLHPDALFPVHGIFWISSRCLESVLRETHAGHPDFARHAAYLALDKGWSNYIVPGNGADLAESKLLINRYYDLMLKLFDKDFYLDNNPDIKACGIDPRNHYERFGQYESRVPCGLVSGEILQQHPAYQSLLEQKDSEVDALYYLKTYLPAALSFMLHNETPQQHYRKFGKAAGFLPSEGALPAVLRDRKACNCRYSIIIPVYNSEDYLTNCLESAYNQTVEDVEVIIVNDGSPDNSHRIIEQFRQKYPDRTKVITHEQNQGLVRTHRDGIAAASGDYFTILDGDDWLNPDFCESMGALALAYEADCVSCGWTRPVAYTKPKTKSFIPLDIRILENETKIDSVVHWRGYPNIHYGLNRKLYQLKSWRKINPINCKESILYFEDGIVTLRYMVECSRVVIIRNPLYHWYNNAASVGNKLIGARYVNDIFDVIDNLSFLCRHDKDPRATLFSRNIDNIFLTEFLRRVKEKAAKDTPAEMMKLIECFAERFDHCSHLFTRKQADTLIEKLMELYYQSCRKSIGAQKPEDFILFVDSVGINHLNDFYLDYWKKTTDIPYKYIQCSATCPFSERLQKMRWGARCRCVVTTGGWSISEFHTCRPIVQLWHGMGALKKVAPHPKALCPKLAFCSSKSVIPVYRDLFGCRKKHILPQGSIVADAYMNQTMLHQACTEFYQKYPACIGKKIYLWCPTFRGRAPHIYIQDHLDFAAISENLAADEVFLVKHHPAVDGFGKKAKNPIRFHNVIDVTAEELYPVLSVASVFMTDYSSALHCAMLRDIPVCFLVTDEASYVKEQGLLIDYQNLPGPKCTNTNVNYIIQALRSAKTATQAYRRFKNYHVGGCHGHSVTDITKSIIAFYRKKT